VAIVALPASIGVGILKYRLYEIDRLISRTLAYAIVTGLLAGVYAGLVLLATQVFGFRGPGRAGRRRDADGPARTGTRHRLPGGEALRSRPLRPDETPGRPRPATALAAGGAGASRQLGREGCGTFGNPWADLHSRC
jgi:hypothetical protein